MYNRKATQIWKRKRCLQNVGEIDLWSKNRFRVVETYYIIATKLQSNYWFLLKQRQMSIFFLNCFSLYFCLFLFLADFVAKNNEEVKSNKQTSTFAFLRGRGRIITTFLAKLEILALPLRATLPRKTLICLLHSLAALMSSSPTSCFAHELPFQLQMEANQPHFQLELCIP